MNTQKSRPSNAEEWKEHWEKNRALNELLKKSEISYITISDDQFRADMQNYSPEILRSFLEKMKGDLRFYRAILNEPYYVKYPHKKSTMRYEDALSKYKSVNRKGSILHSIINQ